MISRRASSTSASQRHLTLVAAGMTVVLSRLESLLCQLIDNPDLVGILAVKDSAGEDEVLGTRGAYESGEELRASCSWDDAGRAPG